MLTIFSNCFATANPLCLGSMSLLFGIRSRLGPCALRRKRLFLLVLLAPAAAAAAAASVLGASVGLCGQLPPVLLQCTGITHARRHTRKTKVRQQL
jgi:hypothetical protein